MRLIDADDFANRMYHEAFEKDSDLQKWDSGCWIRYKLFENVLREQPTVQPEIIRCKDCKHRHVESMVWTCPFGLPGGENFFCGYGTEPYKGE